MLSKIKYTGLIALFTCISTAPCLAIDGGQMAPPDVKVVDRFGVDLSTGLVSQSLETVSIGGELGLTHSIRLLANEFRTTGGHGFMDGFAGRARYEPVIKGFSVIETDSNGNVQLKSPGGLGEWTYAMRVSGPAGSHEFVVYKNGYIKNAVGIASGYSYKSVGDSRHTLAQVTQGSQPWLVWTTPGGVETWYKRDGTDANIGGYFEYTRYPNGLKVSVSFGAVTANTGFALKYQFADNSGNRWGTNPSGIVGLNLAYTNTCSFKSTTVCNAADWPKVSFLWPTGAPNVFFTPNQTSNQIFSVTDQHGSVTEYHYQTQNLCLTDTANPSSESSGCNLLNTPEKWTSRLVGIKSANSNTIDTTYKYQNHGSMLSLTSPDLGVYTYWQLDNKVGRIARATKIDDSSGYSDPRYGQTQYGEAYTWAGGNIQATVMTYYPGVLREVVSDKQGRFIYEENARNFVRTHYPVSGPTTGYSYDSRGNLYQIAQNGGIVMQSAAYPATCSNPKTCNKPLWIKDAKGGQTDYSYHAESGQVKTVTGPAVNINGASVRPKTTYEYAQHFATYYHYNASNDSFTLQQSGDGIWLLSSEWSCRTSNALSVGTGCAAGAQDLVVKDYYYGPQNGSTPNNLLLRGESITAYNYAGAEETRVTCYEYDKYGNRIGETPPKGNTATTANECP